MVQEQALVGREEIARFLNINIWALDRELPAMKQARIIMSRKVGKPPHRTVKLMAFPSTIKLYWMKRYAKD